MNETLDMLSSRICSRLVVHTSRDTISDASQSPRLAEDPTSDHKAQKETVLQMVPDVVSDKVSDMVSEMASECNRSWRRTWRAIDLV